MKRINKYFTTIALLSCILIIGAACERDNDIVIPQTRVDKVSETSVTVGDEMTFTGTNMHLITKVLFGEVEAPLDLDLAKRDRNKLTVVVPLLKETQKVALTAIYNTESKLILVEGLEVIVPPVIPTVTSALPASVMSGNVVELEGTDLDIIKSVKVGDTEVGIRSKDNPSLSFLAPEVETETSAVVTLIYDNTIGANQVLTVSGMLKIAPAVVPAVTSPLPASVESGATVAIEGTDLNIVTGIRLGDNAVNIQEKTDVLLSFVAPAVTEETTLAVTLIYANTLGADRELALNKSLVVKPVTIIPEPETKVLKWENVLIGGQSTGLSFFNASTGAIVTTCEVFENQAEIDFMMNVSNSGENQFYDPSNTNNVLSNQTCGGLALGKGDGKDYSILRATSTLFRILTASGAQGELADKVKADAIEEITDELFTGISKPSSNTPNGFAVGQVVWFYNARKDKNGLIEIKAVNPGATAGENTIVMDVYFQK